MNQLINDIDPNYDIYAYAVWSISMFAFGVAVAREYYIRKIRRHEAIRNRYRWQLGLDKKGQNK